MTKSSKMTMDKYSDSHLKFRGECLGILLKKFGDIKPETKYSLKDIYECVEEWTSKGHKISVGIVDYFNAYYNYNEGQKSSKDAIEESKRAS